MCQTYMDVEKKGDWAKLGSDLISHEAFSNSQSKNTLRLEIGQFVLPTTVSDIEFFMAFIYSPLSNCR